MTAFCSIIARNYFAQALSLIESLRKSGQCEHFVLLIIDCEEEDKELHSNTSLEVLSCDDLDIQNLLKRRFKYNITEFSTSVKAKLILKLFEKGHSKVIYLDPDILVLNSLSVIIHKLDCCDVLLTPHMDTPTPYGWQGVDHFSMMATGIYNLGFIGVRKSENALLFLTWWDSQLENRCVDEQQSGVFTDQKYLDVATTLFRGFSILEEPGYNVAPWNLHSRSISKNDDSWMCNGEPLYFYHFSNYNIKKPDTIAGYMDGISFSLFPNLKLLYQEYQDYLVKNNYSFYSELPYKHDYFQCGIKIDNSIRKVYREKRYLYETISDPFSSQFLAAFQVNILHGTLMSILFRIKHRAINLINIFIPENKCFSKT